MDVALEMNHSKPKTWEAGSLGREVIRVDRVAVGRGIPSSVTDCSNLRLNLRADGPSLGKLRRPALYDREAIFGTNQPFPPAKCFLFAKGMIIKRLDTGKFLDRPF